MSDPLFPIRLDAMERVRRDVVFTAYHALDRSTRYQLGRAASAKLNTAIQYPMLHSRLHSLELGRLLENQTDDESE